MLEKLELFMYRRATAIVSVTESFKHDLIKRGIDEEKIHVIRNGVDLDRYQPLPRSEQLAEDIGVSGKFVVAYLGTHGMAHDLGNVLRAAKLLETNPEIVFLFVGDGAQKKAIQAQAVELNLENVVFHDSVPKRMMPELWSICDIALVHLKNDPVFSTVIPSKVFEALGMAKPVMIVQPDGEAAEIVRNADAGVWVPPEQPELLADAVRKCHADPALVARYSKNAEIAAGSHSRDRLAAKMAVTLGRIAEP